MAREPETRQDELRVEELDDAVGGLEGPATLVAPSADRSAVDVGGAVATFTLDKNGKPRG